MEVEILAVCDAATEHGGKINIVGVFDAIHAPTAPIATPPCSIAIRMRFMSLEAGSKNIRIAIVDADGRAVMPNLNATILVQVPPNLPSATAQILLGIQQLKLPHFGEYSIRLAVDGREEGATPLFARQIELPPAPPG